VAEDERDPPLAAVDVGTNSFHLLIARPIGGKRFEVVTTEKEMVRLGSGSGDMKTLAPDAIQRGVETLERFRRIADGAGASVRAVATSAVREAENRDDFLRRAKAEAGVEVEVISGVEEARLIHLGVLQAVPVFDQRLLLVDIGGGSTEFLVGQRGDVVDALSVKLGAIRLTDRFFSDDPVTTEQVDACRAYVRAYLAPVVLEIGRHPFDVAVGSSGTISSVAELVLATRGDAGARTANVSFTRSDVDAVVDALVAAPTVKDRLTIPGMDPRRADIIVGGAVLLQQAMADLHIAEMTVSNYALREGLLLDTLQRADDASLHHLGEIRSQAVQHLAALVPEEREHGEHARTIALALFDATESLHGLGEDCRELLEAASLLANVGLVISHARHHLHSYYVIRNSEQLTGFTEREVELVAQVARYHRKSAPKAKHLEYTSLTEHDQHIVRVLAGILRVANALDRTYAGHVAAVTCALTKETLTVQVEARGDTSLELYTAEQRRHLLEEALGVEIRFVAELAA